MNKSYVTYLHDYPTRNAVSNYPYLADNTFSAANINYKGTTYKKDMY